MSRARRLTLLGGVAAAIILMAALLYWVTHQDTSLSRLQKEGVIRIGYAVEAPYAFLEPGQEVTGESPEVARQIVARLAISHIEWRQVEFGSLIDELQAERIDVIAAGMFITPERAKIVSFSEPIFHVNQGLLVAKGNPRQLHAYEQIQTQPNLKIAVLAGSTEEHLLLQLGILKNQLVIVPDALTGRIAVEAGVVDGLALSAPTIQSMVLQGQVGKVEAAQPFEQPRITEQKHLGYGAFAFRKQDIALLKAWNALEKGYIGSPEHLRLIARFGFTQAELPGSTTAQEISAP
jgi:polar amino acid transport system substrate-binding protein